MNIIKKQDASIWFDVTDLVIWSGNFTGIQRTVFELGMWLNENYDLRFYKYDSDSGFSEVEKPLNFDVFTSQAANQTSHLTASIRSQSSIINLKTQVKKLSKRILPSRIRNAVISAKQSLQMRKKGMLNKSQSSIFSKSDVILTFGSPWGSEGLTNELFAFCEELELRLVPLVYDLIPIFYPQFFGEGLQPYFQNYMRNLVTHSEIMLAISQSTADDLHKFIIQENLPPRLIEVVRLGDNPEDSGLPEKPTGFEIKGDFVLSVGTIEIRKNFTALYQVWAYAQDLKISLPPLVIVGRPGWLSDELLHQIKHDPRVREKIIILSQISDAELKWLYSNCLFTIYPSWYEGWGLPISESLRNGKLCISSSSSSMPEVGGDLVVYVDPYDTKEFLRVIHEYSLDEQKRKRKETEIFKKYKPTSWEESATEILKIIERL